MNKTPSSRASYRSKTFDISVHRQVLTGIMPSDAKKKRDLAKKQAAKGKGGKQAKPVTNGEGDSEVDRQENGDDQDRESPTTNGHSETNGNGTCNGDSSEADDIVKRERN